MVVDLLADPRLERKGHLKYTDNFYSNSVLFKEVTEKSLEHVGQREETGGGFQWSFKRRTCLERRDGDKCK